MGQKRGFQRIGPWPYAPHMGGPLSTPPHGPRKTRSGGNPDAPKTQPDDPRPPPRRGEMPPRRPQEAPRTPKMRQDAPKGPPREAPRPSKSSFSFRKACILRDAPKMPQEPPQEASRGVREAGQTPPDPPRRPQDTPGTPARRPRDPPRRPRDPPRQPQDAPRTAPGRPRSPQDPPDPLPGTPKWPISARFVQQSPYPLRNPTAQARWRTCAAAQLDHSSIIISATALAAAGVSRALFYFQSIIDEIDYFFGRAGNMPDRLCQLARQTGKASSTCQGLRSGMDPL